MSLSQALQEPARRPLVVTTLAGVVDAAVADRPGLSGATMRAAYRTVIRLGPGVLPNAINAMLPDFLDALDPFWRDWSTLGDGTFGAYLSAHADQASEALLAVTDERAASADQQLLVRAYTGVRGRAVDNVILALPRLGDSLQQLMTGG